MKKPTFVRACFIKKKVLKFLIDWPIRKQTSYIHTNLGHRKTTVLSLYLENALVLVKNYRQ